VVHNGKCVLPQNVAIVAYNKYVQQSESAGNYMIEVDARDKTRHGVTMVTGLPPFTETSVKRLVTKALCCFDFDAQITHCVTIFRGVDRQGNSELTHLPCVNLTTLIDQVHTWCGYNNIGRGWKKSLQAHDAKGSVICLVIYCWTMQNNTFRRSFQVSVVKEVVTHKVTYVM
jgi:hypothetical protein